jgi:hypothetical protein
LVSYLIGYAVSERGASKEDIQDALDRVFAEAEARPDLGVGAIWSPEAGGGTRPSSILVRNCASATTASLEMDADALGNLGVKSPAMHFVWSFQTAESGKLTDEEAHRYVGEVLDKLGLSHHRSFEVVHRDTMVRDADGNVIDGNFHVHVAVGSVDPHTGLAYDKTGLYRRMAWVEREVEISHGLLHDRGLAVVRNQGAPDAHVEWASKIELAAWRAQRQEERLVRLEKRTHEAYRTRDVAFSRYADAAVAPRLQTALDLARERGRKSEWATLHTVSARYGCEIQRDADGRTILRDVGIGELRLEHETARKDLRNQVKSQGVDRDAMDDRIAEMRAEHQKLEAEERLRKRESGETVLLDDVLRDDRHDMPAFQTLDESEASIIAQVEAQPELVLQDVTAQSSTFMREDLDLWLASRISDPNEIERLGDLIMRDASIRMLSADTIQPLMTTTDVLQIEDRLAEDAHALAHTASGITKEQIDAAISAYEAEASGSLGKRFQLSGEQRSALYGLSRGSLSAIEGLPGVGKTTCMSVVRILGEQSGKEVVGMTLSQAAAERLEGEAGFACVNTARARILEEGGTPVIPEHGIVVVDESSQIDSRAQQRILQLARERGCVVLEIGDNRQLQPIDFGASFRIVKQTTQGAGTFSELRNIQRQKRDWHKDAVVRMADAIVEKDEGKRTQMVREALGILDRNGAITWVKDRDAAIDKAVEVSRIHRAFGYKDTLTLGSDKDTVRHLSEQDRKLSGTEGQGRRYVTTGGIREFAAGDRLMFFENSLGKRGLGVRNGDRGDVIEATVERIVVRMDAGDGREGRLVSFSPRSYKSFDYANASTVHKAQGASVDAAVAVIDRSASAELAFVAMSRSKQALDIVVPKTSFKDLDEFAEHVANRITLKTTTRTYDEVIERTGGPETLRVQNIEAQREAAPLRRIYDAEIVEPVRAVQSAEIKTIRQAYVDRKHEIAASAASMEERLEAQYQALRSMRKEMAQIFKAHQPEPFGEWLHARERARERLREHQVEREAERQAEIQREMDQQRREADRLRDQQRQEPDQAQHPDHQEGHHYGHSI